MVCHWLSISRLLIVASQIIIVFINFYFSPQNYHSDILLKFLCESHENKVVYTMFFIHLIDLYLRIVQNFILNKPLLNMHPLCVGLLNYR